ncbi:hypothetical protein PFISCL1PPCAC_6742, partial [Pristionchus fissidentatus]
GTGLYGCIQLFTTKPNYAAIDVISRIYLHESQREKYFARRREIVIGKEERKSEMKDSERVPSECRVGDRCVLNDEGKKNKATVRWIGRMAGRSSVYAGLEFDEPVGDGTGMHQGKQLFETAPGHAGFMLLSTVTPFVVSQSSQQSDPQREREGCARSSVETKVPTVCVSGGPATENEDLIVHYIDQNGQIHECTQQEAQMWLYKGFFTSETKFTVVRRGTKLNGKEEVWSTLVDLISLNGRAMPFLPYYKNEEEREEEINELKRLGEELGALQKRRMAVIDSMRKAEQRRAVVHREMERIASKLVQPDTSTRNVQTHATLSTVVGEGNTEESVSPILPKTGVDPFALLRCCTAKRKMQGDFVTRFKQLRICFDRCDKKQLVSRTLRIFKEYDVRMCQLCRVKIDSTNNVMEHICSGKHITAMQGSICADAFDFWWSAVQETTTGKALVVSFVNPFPQPTLFRLSGDTKAPRVNKDWKVVEGAPPSANTLALWVLRRPTMRVERPCGPFKPIADRLSRGLKNCDKKILDNDPITRPLFVKPLLCLICNRCAIDKASNLITHIVGNGHVDLVVKENIPMSQDAIEFWVRAISRASK